MRKGTITGARTYADLEAAFVRRLAEALSEGQRPAWVLTPTNLVALHLRRRAAHALGGVAGVEFLTLVDAARRLTLRTLAAEGLAPLPAGAAELALQGILDGVPDGSYFATFRRFRNASSALLTAVRLLAASLWTPPMLARAARRARFRDQAAARRLGELADVWDAFERWKADARAFEEDDLILRAASARTGPPERPAALLLYGFYDFTPAQQALTGRLVALAGTADAYLLYAERDGAPAPGFEFAAPTVHWLRETLGCGDLEPAARAATGSDLERLVEGLFADAELPEDAAARDYDGTVRVANCPGEPAEAAQVVRAVLRAARESDAPVRVGVLLRGAEESAALLAESFDHAGVECYTREGLPLAESVAGRIALALAELAAGDAERAPVIEFLSLARVRWPEDLSATFLDRASRLAGITRGRAEWVGRLRERAGWLRREAAPRGERGRRVPPPARGRALHRRRRVPRRLLPPHRHLRRLDVVRRGGAARRAGPRVRSGRRPRERGRAGRYRGPRPPGRCRPPGRRGHGALDAGPPPGAHKPAARAFPARERHGQQHHGGARGGVRRRHRPGPGGEGLPAPHTRIISCDGTRPRGPQPAGRTSRCRSAAAPAGPPTGGALPLPHRRRLRRPGHRARLSAPGAGQRPAEVALAVPHRRMLDAGRPACWFRGPRTGQARRPGRACAHDGARLVR